MNFQDLLTKMRQLDETPSYDVDGDETARGKDLVEPDDSVDECGEPTTPADALFGEQGMEECGMPGMDNMPHGMMGTPKQSDSVTMNVSMNGSGAGGIRDLMSILKNIEQGETDAPAHDHDDVNGILVGMGEEQNDGGFQSATTEPDSETAGIDAVTQTGNDIHSQGDEAEKVNGGGNPMGVDESLVQRLTQQYEAIKEGKKEKEPEGLYSSKRQETDSQRIARLAREKRQAQNKERMKNDYNAEMER